MKAELRARIVPQAVRLILRAIIDGYDYNPGSSDLDDEQIIHVRMTLGNIAGRANGITLITHKRAQNGALSLGSSIPGRYPRAQIQRYWRSPVRYLWSTGRHAQGLAALSTS